jgi:hypothetical protein
LTLEGAAGRNPGGSRRLGEVQTVRLSTSAFVFSAVMKAEQPKETFRSQRTHLICAGAKRSLLASSYHAQWLPKALGLSVPRELLARADEVIG